MRIVEIREKTVPLQSSIRNSYIDFSKMTASIVAVVTDQTSDSEPIIGYGFNSNGRYGQGAILRDRIVPRVMALGATGQATDAGDNLDPFKLWDATMLNEKPGGHGERSVAVGALDMAIWDAVAKIAEAPLWRLLAQRYNRGDVNPDVFVYAAGGYYQPGKDLQALRDEMQGYLDLGFSVVKMKIGGADIDEDQRRIEAVLDIVGDGARLAVDANGRFELAEALAFGAMLEPYNLRWYEEAGDPLDFELNAELAARYPHPLATGENLFSMQDARNLIRYGGMRPDLDILQFDPALSYGLVEYLRTIEMLEANGWSRRQCVPHGGHLMALNIAAGLGLGGNEAYPGVFQPFGGFPDDVTVDRLTVRMGERPGIGFEGKADLITLLRSVLD